MIERLTDTQLVESFLAHTDEMTQVEAAALADVSQRTISAWRAGARPSLRPKLRRALEAVLSKGGSAKTKAGAEAAHPEVVRQIDEVNAGAGSAWEKAWLVAEINAAYRAHAFDELAVALRIAEQNAAVRAETARAQVMALSAEADGARERIAIGREQRPTGAAPSPYKKAPERAPEGESKGVA